MYKKLLLLSCLLFASAGLWAQPKSLWNTADNNLLLEGYDLVSYFTQQKAIKGTATLAVTYKGNLFYFSSQQNKEAFKLNPEAYLPQYGGWCAYAMGSSGEFVEVDPETFKLINGKLYLFYNKYFTNTLKLWNKEETKLKSNADANWSKQVKNNQ